MGFIEIPCERYSRASIKMLRVEMHRGDRPCTQPCLDGYPPSGGNRDSEKYRLLRVFLPGDLNRKPSNGQTYFPVALFTKRRSHGGKQKSPSSGARKNGKNEIWSCSFAI